MQVSTLSPSGWTGKRKTLRNRTHRSEECSTPIHFWPLTQSTFSSGCSRIITAGLKTTWYHISCEIDKKKAFQTGPVNTFHSRDLLRQLFFVDIEIMRPDGNPAFDLVQSGKVFVEVFTSHEYFTKKQWIQVRHRRIPLILSGFWVARYWTGHCKCQSYVSNTNDPYWLYCFWTYFILYPFCTSHDMFINFPAPGMSVNVLLKATIWHEILFINITIYTWIQTRPLPQHSSSPARDLKRRALWALQSPGPHNSAACIDQNELMWIEHSSKPQKTWINI